MNFVHLHVHSHYSLLNGLTKIKPLVLAAKQRGFTALALTDNGAMYGAIEFYKTCIAEGIKPIIGFDAYVQNNDIQNGEMGQGQKIYRMVLLAENYEGYVRLMKLCSEGQLYGLVNGKPCINREMMQKYTGGIIALSGNIEGEIPQLLKDGNIKLAEKLAREYETLFGKDNFYLELQDHPAIEGQLDVNTKLVQLSKDTGIPLVVSRDVHYLQFEDAEAQDILRCISEGWKVDYTDREDYRHVDRSFNTQEDITSRFRHIPEAIENTGKIADRVNLEIELDKWHFAPVELPPGKNADDVLREEAFRCAPTFFPEMGKEIVDRLEYELDIIKTKGYSPYFICVADFVDYAKQHGIVESTRGSAAGSLVSYVLGITTVDPIRFKLPFERFLNPFRPSPPDIDTDFADDRREEMIEYVTRKYGEDKVAQIITFGSMAARASVRDVGRALGLSYNFCDQVAKLIPPGAQGFPMTIERALKEEPDLKKLYESNDDVQRLLTLAQKVEGCARHTSIHAAGVVISPTPLTDFSPVQRETGGEKLVTQFEMKSVEAAGVLKNDFLGIRNLAILGNAMEIVEKTTGEKVNIYNLPLDDEKTFDMLARGETMGVFQLSGSGMTRWLKELKPNRIDDIMAMVALYRPGPMECIPEYIQRKYHPELIKFPDPRLEDILKMSYGLLVYQDDVMLTAITLAGYDWMDADKFRKAMGKKIPEEMAKQKIQFYDGCQKIGGLKKEVIDDLWHAIEPFAAYGFNKAHAASYGMVAYQTAYMKAHYPVQYMTSILQAEFGDVDKVAAIVQECHRMNIEVLPPDINESFKNFAMVSKPGEKGRIRFGLTAIKNVGEHICDVIYRERKANGQYKNLEDFLTRIQDKDLNKRSLESLIQAGALDYFKIDRGILLASIENLLFFSKQLKEKEKSHQDSLFSGTNIELDSKVILSNVKGQEATMAQKLVWEKQLMGLYISSHPFLEYEKLFGDTLTPLNACEYFDRDAWIVIGGVVDKIQKKITKKGDIMLFVTIQDTSSSLELLVFPKTYKTTQTLWAEGACVCVVGKTPREEGENKVYVENLYVLNHENKESVARQVKMGFSGLSKEKSKKAGSETPREKSITLTLSAEDLQSKGNELKEFFAKNPGEYQVYIRVGGNMIRANSKIGWDDTIQEVLRGIIGESVGEVSS
ncbi:MAG: DNA polymerase III subunit alpha [Candidatus Magasanikbacteria bacterium CG11_big_fil_rev_8_21_14_0_20_39_34]|uniref:DNA polymerase III subunit alpha n=1 Tax=Candidatus Magasanikbacteria bacterium CG11_big_fil_rev_8_21_14_0_20_39_34 TaxID=1974653 RepID=A0A2H0N433_9BACT|nr:MAG: DNA polymerase III subunit alpha [Candidatus Magasanikbacteria bacterium CG11_big_fil_rev_8_21_14_0_20_39_34]